MSHWNRSHPRARKEHVCTMCGRVIEAGEVYMRGVGIDGTAWTWKECAHCDALFGYLMTMWLDGEYSADDAGEWEPESVSHLRVKAHWLKCWRRADGTLFPVPTFGTDQPDGAS